MWGMVIYLYGADSKRSREHLGKLVEKFVRERDPERLNNKILEVSDTNGAAVRLELMSAPFLAEKRLVVLERLLERGSAELLEWFAQRFLEQEGPADTIVIIWEDGAPKKNKVGVVVEQLRAALENSKYAQEFVALEGRQREQWVVRMVSERGGKITLPAAATLARRETDDFALSNTLDILLAYATGRIITEEDADLFLPPDLEKTIFEAMDALSIKNRAAASKLLGNVWVVDNDPVYIFAMLHRQVRFILQGRELVDDNPRISEAAVARTLGVHPFLAKKILAQVHRWSRADLIRWYDALIGIDYAIKHGNNDPHILIDKFVAV